MTEPLETSYLFNCDKNLFLQSFEKVFSELMEKVSIPKQTSDGKYLEYFYFQDYSSINEHRYAQTYDIVGGQLWITFQNRTNPDFLIQINVRHFDQLIFHSNPIKDLNVVCGRILFIYKWQTLATYNFNFKELGANISPLNKVAREYLNDTFCCYKMNYHYYELSAQIIAIIKDYITISRHWIEKEDVIIPFLKDIEYTESFRNWKKAFNNHLKESVSTEFGHGLCIR